jgi:hypothetical protein
MQDCRAKGATFLPHLSFSSLGIFSLIDKNFATFWWKKEPFLRQPLKAVMEDRNSCH